MGWRKSLRRALAATGLKPAQKREAEYQEHRANDAAFKEEQRLEQIRLTGIETAKLEEEEEKKRIKNMYGYSSTIKTSGAGVLGMAPVSKSKLLGGN